MSLLPKCEFHCLSYDNAARSESMRARFQKFGLDLTISPGVPHTDPRVIDAPDSDLRRLWSITYGHLDMARVFLEGSQKYGVFCENDILISGDFDDHLNTALFQFESLDLDLLLIGYMTTQPITSSSAHPLLLKEDFGKTIFGYPEYQWGAHMYVLSRNGAERLLAKFEDGSYAAASILNPEKAFSPDWTITKLSAVGENGRGRRALLYPMIAVEDGSDGIEHYRHQGQLDFHKATFEFNTRGRIFL
jgi:hypothetical protein